MPNFLSFLFFSLKNPWEDSKEPEGLQVHQCWCHHNDPTHTLYLLLLKMGGWLLKLIQNITPSRSMCCWNHKHKPRTTEPFSNTVQNSFVKSETESKPNWSRVGDRGQSPLASSSACCSGMNPRGNRMGKERSIAFPVTGSIAEIRYALDFSTSSSCLFCPLYQWKSYLPESLNVLNS